MPSFQSHLSRNPDNQEKLLGIDEVFEQVMVMDSPESLFDLPPESFWVPKNSEIDWLHENANMQRRTSTKLHGRSSSGSKSSFSLIALPKPRNPKFSADANIRQNHATTPKSTRLFRSLSEPGGGGGLMHVAEPGSPRVSCTGKVRLKNKEGGRRTGLWKRLWIVLRSRFAPNRELSKGGGESQSKNKIRRQSSL